MTEGQLVRGCQNLRCLESGLKVLALGKGRVPDLYGLFPLRVDAQTEQGHVRAF